MIDLYIIETFRIKVQFTNNDRCPICLNMEAQIAATNSLQEKQNLRAAKERHVRKKYNQNSLVKSFKSLSKVYTTPIIKQTKPMRFYYIDSKPSWADEHNAQFQS